MAVKSDRWIRRIGRRVQNDRAVRTRSGQRGRRPQVVSYGTSSYGYDVRCADEFKLFTNIYSAIVDPKKFDDKSFVDMKADYVIIPPNSFASRAPLNTFAFPANVMTICWEKAPTRDAE
jgi:dCTP deaminase